MTTAIFALVVSVVSFLAALTSLYFSHIQGPNIKVRLSPWFKLYHTSAGALSFYFTVTFINSSNRIGFVDDVSLVAIQKKKFYFPWRSFSKYNAASGAWEYLETPHTIAVPGRSTVTQTIWYSWPEDTEGEKPLIGRDNSIELQYKINAFSKIHAISARFSLDDDEENRIQSLKDSHKATTVDLTLAGALKHVVSE